MLHAQAEKDNARVDALTQEREDRERKKKEAEDEKRKLANVALFQRTIGAHILKMLKHKAVERNCAATAALKTACLSQDARKNGSRNAAWFRVPRF